MWTSKRSRDSEETGTESECRNQACAIELAIGQQDTSSILQDRWEACASPPLSRPLTSPHSRPLSMGCELPQKGRLLSGNISSRSRCGLAMVPYHNKHTPQAMVPDEVSCGIVSTFIVTEQIKSIITRECDPRNVNFVHEGFEGAAH